MDARMILERMWRRSMFDAATCKTLEEYAAAVAGRLRTAYGDELDDTVEAVVEAMNRHGILD